MPGCEIGFEENEIRPIVAADNVPALAEVLDDTRVEAAPDFDEVRR
ncbi:hypothetical protein [Methylobacterium sp. SD21]